MGTQCATLPAAPGFGAAGSARLRRLLFLLLAPLAVTYLLVCVGLHLAQPHLIYYPSPRYQATPADLHLDYEDLTLLTEDGVAIAAWFVPHAGDRAVLFCHGNGENLGDLPQTIQNLHEFGLAVLAFDYRGYGRSEGLPTEEGLYRDAEAAWKWLSTSRHYGPENILIAGRSLGGAVAIETARRHPPGGLLVESTFTSMVDVGGREYPLLPVSLLCTHRYESVRKTPHIRCPKLFIHGNRDELVPMSLARELFDAAAEPKQFLETAGGHTNGGFEYNWETLQSVGGWVNETLPRG